jgi:hypothetical protein
MGAVTAEVVVEAAFMAGVVVALAGAAFTAAALVVAAFMVEAAIAVVVSAEAILAHEPARLTEADMEEPADIPHRAAVSEHEAAGARAREALALEDQATARGRFTKRFEMGNGTPSGARTARRDRQWPTTGARLEAPRRDVMVSALGRATAIVSSGGAASMAGAGVGAIRASAGDSALAGDGGGGVWAGTTPGLHSGTGRPTPITRGGTTIGGGMVTRPPPSSPPGGNLLPTKKTLPHAVLLTAQLTPDHRSRLQPIVNLPKRDSLGRPDSRAERSSGFPTSSACSVPQQWPSTPLPQ